ncbi:serine hydrolase [Pseudoalteromonas sp. MSK9-3]|uniref:serine hydrolase domain-containing protein n=1 Tax=Pseudoalteromonas sp. MSK9-3 TaxID=1897633 RepID=UPI000E6C3638|nr:serine hydrolase domain-containing protein [Pseudoalteromonas sp. MSK9-3]RJE73277.1 serine hydrolase [Pseudoalteromonas sp. MSK9-3]
MVRFIALSVVIGICTFSVLAQTLKFDAVLQCHNSLSEPGMVVRLEQCDKLIYSGAIGIADLKTMRQLQVDDVFQIGSITKTFTAAAIFKLLESNKLSLKDPVGKFIPNINPHYKHLTLEHILSHTSGLPDYLDDPTVHKVWGEYASIENVINRITRKPVQSKPTEEYSYSNLGYILLGKVIEVASGLPYSAYLEEVFFKPLQMKNTFVMTKGLSVGNVQGYTERDPAEKQYIKAEQLISRSWKVDRSWIYSSGAIASTLADMSRWNKALSSGEVITLQNFTLMATKTRLNSGKYIKYGLGLNIQPLATIDSLSHEGMVPGFFSWNVHFPEHNLFATAFSNADTKHPGPMLLDMIALQLKLSPEPLIDSQKVKQLAQKLVGRYQSSSSKVLTISLEGNTLYAQYGDDTKRKIIPREDSSFSNECTENYFQLRENAGKREIVPIYLYQGEQEALIKL